MTFDLASGAKKFGVELQPSSIDKFIIYEHELLRWNKKINLTAITEPKDIAVKHFLDSLTLCKYINFKQIKSVIDVGTGAGFPGVPLKIVYPEISLTLLDSLKKRIVFLQELLQSLNLNARTLHERAEESSKKAELREQFDFAVSRAVARLPVLAEYCLPYVKIGGTFAAMKQGDSYKEIATAEQIISALGGTIESIEQFYLPEVGTRMIIIIKKVKATPLSYPRNNASINRSH